MDWARAIKINQSALSRIIAALIAMVGLQAGAALARLPRPLYRSALRILRPAESAVRRLIVIAARGVVVKPSPVRPIPEGLKRAARGKSKGRVSFQLFDPRQRCQPWWSRYRAKAKLPRSWVPEDKPAGMVSYRPEDFGKPEPVTDGSVDASRLGRRLEAIKQALETLPAQAKRLVCWQAKRKAKAKFTSPLRQGRPPGHRKKPREDVDYVLKECHALAREVLRDDSS